jgi:hypothetical protein
MATNVIDDAADFLDAYGRRVDVARRSLAASK